MGILRGGVLVDGGVIVGKENMKFKFFLTNAVALKRVDEQRYAHFYDRLIGGWRWVGNN